jgi:hypothetical protein
LLIGLLIVVKTLVMVEVFLIVEKALIGIVTRHVSFRRTPPSDHCNAFWAGRSANVAARRQELLDSFHRTPVHYSPARPELTFVVSQRTSPQNGLLS